MWRGIVFAAIVFAASGNAQRLIGRVTSRRFDRNMTAVPETAASLTFVFDVTGSMWDDLKQVIAGARKIMETTLKRQEVPLYDYILIPFHDPNVGPITVTTDPAKFQKQLRQLYVQGGGDCPEMSITAISEALKLSLPGSFIYVFTDARSKDYQRLDEVLKIIQRKQSQVIFVLTGDCGMRSHPGYKAYEKIAATSSGQVFVITKSDVSEVVKFIEVSVRAHKVVLMATDHDSRGTHEWNIPFDPELREVTISVSGPGRNLKLYDPDGVLVTQRNGLETLLDLEQVLIVNLKSPKIGIWRVIASSTGEHSLRVTGLSILDFHTRFSRKKTLNWKAMDFQPIEGIPTHVLVNVTGLPDPGTINVVRVLNLGGDIIQDIELRGPTEEFPTMYSVPPFLTPSIDFYISVLGVTHEGFPFIRSTKNAILNIAAVAPSVFMEPTYPGYFDYPAEIPCKVQSLIPFAVKWQRQFDDTWITLRKHAHHEQSGIDYLRIDDVEENSEGIYRCIANNSKGVDFAETFFDVEELPPIITVPYNVTAPPHTDVTLTCNIKSKIKFTVEWRRSGGLAFDSYRGRLMSNNSLMIHDIQPGDEGGYICQATNEGGVSTGTVYLKLEEFPRAVVTPKDPHKYVTGDRLTMRCKVTGFPTPTIAWRKGNVILEESEKIRFHRNSSVLKVWNAEQSDEGSYVCGATNTAGTAVDSARMVYTEPPTATIQEDDVMILEGLSHIFDCQVTGTPTPRVIWLRDGVQLAFGIRYFLVGDSSLQISAVRAGDDGNYTCIAKNDIGQAMDFILLRVGIVPHIKVVPEDIGIDIGQDGFMPCVAEGYPYPEISWSYSADDGATEETITYDAERIFQDELTNSLNVFSIEMGDEGTYTCHAINQFGFDSGSAEIRVTGLVSPRIVLPDSRFNVIEGNSIKLPCPILIGNPLPTRQWLRQDVDYQPTGRIEIDKEGSVVIRDARTQDAGLYVCSANNVAGNYQVDIDLDVWVPPNIFNFNDRYTTIEGKTTRLVCEASGNPQPNIEWTKEGGNLNLRYSPHYNVHDDGSLVITNTTPQHTGTYTCTATNQAGEDRRSSYLKVFYKPRSKDDAVNLYTVIEEDTITMECPVTISDPPPTFSWIKNGQKIVEVPGQYEILKDGSLKIFSSRLSDDGSYTCIAMNEAGSVEYSMKLVVYVPPIIFRGPDQILGLDGEDLIIHCDASGIPVPTIRWQFEDIEIDSKGRFKIISEGPNSGASELHLAPARLVDDGIYRCIAENIAGNDIADTTVDIQIAPRIQQNEQDFFTPSTGDDLSIHCEAFGDPKPVIRWYHDGEEVTGKESDVNILSNGTLVLLSVNQADTGEYTCEAENDLGNIKIISNVVVHEPPSISNSGDITTMWILEGNPAKMLCEANAVPKPTIHWFRVEQNVERAVREERHRIKFEQDNSLLQIMRTILSDTGRYRCKAINEEGETFKLFDLNVYRLPSIDGGDMVDLKRVIQGNDLVLNCPATGVPFPHITWYKGTEPIDELDERISFDDRRRQLTIRNTDLEHDGDYRCEARNNFGSDEKDFGATILVPPFVEGDDMDHRVLVGSHFTLECIATGIPDPIITWYKDSKEITPSSHYGVKIQNRGNMLDIAEALVDHEGIYECLAENEAGTDSRRHNVDVLVPPGIGSDFDLPDNIDVIKGDNATIFCEATGDPPPVISWYKDGVDITNNPRYTIELGGGILQIINARESDAGEYICSAENEVGIVTQGTNVNVLVPPAIVGEDEVITIVKGETKRLECRVTGNPQPDISWTQFGIPLSEDSTFSISAGGQFLVIQNAQEKDDATYSCIATNSVGKDDKSFQINVNVPPTIHDFSQDSYSVIEGDKITIRCEADGIPVAQFSWLKDGNPLERSTYFKFRENHKVLVILDASVKYHEGTYTCVAKNDAGMDEKDVDVVVLIPPEIEGQKTKVSKTIEEGNLLDLSCRVTRGKPTPVVRWYTGEGQLISRANSFWQIVSGEQILTTPRAQLGNDGEHWCEASNIAGKTIKNFDVDIQVLPLIDGEETIDKSVVLGDNATFQCKVSGIPKPDVIWMRDGVPISAIATLRYIAKEEKSGLHTLTVQDAQEDDQATYMCIASNLAGEDSRQINLDVFLPPSFDGSRITNITILEGQSTDLFCDVNAFPPPNIWWYKDSRPIGLPRSVVDNRLLPVTNAKLSDAGLYKCWARNIAGDTELLFRLNVHSIPTIDGPPVTSLVKLVGDQVDLECYVNGVPYPEITWTKNGKVISPDDKGVQLLSNSKLLRLSNVQLSDTAEFVCHAVNVEGSDRKLYDLTVHEPPSIYGPKQDQLDVNLGDEFVLDCFVTGTPTPNIQWYKDGKIIRESLDVDISDDGMKLTVSNAKILDDGDYVCNASNVEAYDTKEFGVNIRVPPTIDPNDENIWVEEGQNLNLTCNVRSNAAVEIKWLKNGIEITTSARARPSSNGRRLMLFNMQRNDAAAYTCIATNAAGDVEQNTNVDVYTSPKIANEDETETHAVIQSESITLECIVSGYPKPEIEWLRDFYPIHFEEDGISADERFTIQRSGRFLTISNAQIYDEGEYTCRAENEVGIASKNYIVSVLVQPTINRNRLRQNIVVREKAYVRVQCTATGYPAPTIQWMKGDVVYAENDALQANGNYIDQENYLMFFSILEEEADMYTCVAKNIAGVDEAAVTVQVNVPPQIAGKDEFIEVVRGETLTMRCDIARGTPEPTLEWWKRASKLMNSNRVKILDEGRLLQIQPAQTDDYGTFTCVAKNIEGSDRKRTTVHVLEPPEFDNEGIPNEVDVILGFSRYLTCDIHADPPPVLKWFKDGEAIESSPSIKIDRDGHILYIHRARKEDDGFYMCQATNKAGSDDQTTKLNVLIPPQIENDGSDNNVNANKGESTSLNCKVEEGFPEPTVLWYKNRAQIDLLDPNLSTSDNGQTLNIRSASERDAGRYNCQVRNKAGSDSKFFQLNVRVPPTISGPHVSTVTMIQGRSYELDCYSDGTPDPKNTWTKDKLPIEFEYALLSNRQRLQVYRASELDNGVFVCKATNIAGEAEKVFNVVVYMSPTLNDPERFKNIVVNENDDIILDCKSETFPKPNVEWRKNGQAIEKSELGDFLDERIHLEEGGFVLVISGAGEEDAAQYSCDLSNDAGETARSFNVDVNTPPEIFGPENEKVVKTLDSSFSLDCAVQGTPTPEVLWLKGGKPLVFSSNVYKTTGRNIIRIENAKKTDAGLYTCVATNVAGEDRKNFDVDIQVKPSIQDVGTQNLDVILGDSFELRCPVSGNPTPTITWFKDGELILPTNTGPYTAISPSGEELIIARTDLVDDGRYTCEAFNDVGRDDKSFTVNILIPPSIGLRDSLNHVEVNETYTAILDCDIAGGIPPPEISWTRNGEPLPFSQRIRTFNDGRRLEIYRSMTSDTGIYACTATNDAGSVSDDIKLDVYVPPRFENPSPQEIVVLEGEALELDCTVYGVPNPAISWIMSTQEQTGKILTGEEYDFSDDFETAYIQDAKVEDTGVYTCIASSISGNAQKIFNVTVTVPPEILSPKGTKEINVVKGDEFNLDCPVEGIPFPKVIWLKHGKPLPQLDLERVLLNGQRFHVSSAQLADKGAYTCIAKSPAGEDSRDFDVDVFVPPSADSNQTDITAVVGSDVLLECHSNAIPPPTFEWFKNGKPLGHNEREYLLKNVELFDEGIYTCEATNEAGTSSENTKLIVFEKPSMLPTPSDYFVELHDDIELFCFANGVPTPAITWWKDNVEIQKDELDSHYTFLKDSLLVQNARMEDAGRYMCVASNDAGSARKEMNLAVYERPYIEQGDTNITVYANEFVVLPCEVKGTPKPDVIWSKQGVGPFSIKEKTGYRQTEYGSIEISAASVSDTGFYRCIGENDAGEAFKDIQLNVIVAPSIIKGSEKYIVKPSSQLSIPCEATGVPKPQVSWYKGSTPVENLFGVSVQRPKNTLTFSSVNVDLEGLYRCMAINVAGHTSYTPQVLVRDVPRVTTSHEVITALEGTSVKLQCDVEGTPKPTVKWRVGPHEIDFDDVRYTQMYNNALRISQLKLSDTAAYTCVAQNSAGTGYGRVQLEVQVPPKIYSDFPEEVIAIAGQPFTFNVETSGVPTPTNDWYKDDVIILQQGQGSHFIIQDSGSLHIPIVAKDDGGLYRLKTKNPAGEDTVATRLIVHLPPEINPVYSTNITVVQGNQIPLDVSVVGEPEPVTTWTKDGVPIDEYDRRIQFMTFGSIFINNATSTDAGQYVATAINDAGRDSVEFTVTVFIPPTFTQVPSDVGLETGEDLELVCSAAGLPTPDITWKHDGNSLSALNAVIDKPGSSRLVIENVRREDGGTYSCHATNVAGKKVATAFVTVGAPPVFLDEHEPVVVTKLGTTAWIDCAVSATPKATIRWTKDGHEMLLGGRIQQLDNGTLVIQNTIKSDVADYKCTATNDAGSVDRITKLRLENAPVIVVHPQDTVVLAGDAVTLHCVAEGVPEPKITWTKSGDNLPSEDRFTVLIDNSLHIAAAQLDDTAEYECLASNPLGSKLSAAQVTVQVNGGYSQWNDWSGCSASCGKGHHVRVRFCNSPPPANGGKNCAEPNEERKSCQQVSCPINGKWSNYGEWEPCSVPCGQGTQTRSRECNNPVPQFGGLPCQGSEYDQRVCSGDQCIVPGRWTNWSVWSDCSVSCGNGVETRSRSCTNPPPSPGGRNCKGRSTVTRVCSPGLCPVHGKWGEWGAWSFCSASCGGGQRSRVRSCNNPAPLYGGDTCSGSSMQLDNCNPEPCALDGKWTEWGTWGLCPRTCGSGMRTRYRECTNPAPKYGGKLCSGKQSEMTNCDLPICPEDGNWAGWSDWGLCSVTCGDGLQTRQRTCTNPPPTNNGAYCLGDATQTGKCSAIDCHLRPMLGKGVAYGNVNDIPFGKSQILAHGKDIGNNKTRITAVIKNIPSELGPLLQNQVSILTPIFWTLAREIGGAYNGYTLTGAEFIRDVMVEFITGEVVHMHHLVTGVDSDGNVVMDVEVTGNVPTFQPLNLEIKDYSEDYVQTGPGSLYAYSDRFFKIDDTLMLYTWNHTISYDPARGLMPYLIETLDATDIVTDYDFRTEELVLQLDVSIGKGYPSDRCPDGFTLDETGQYCLDEDECATQEPCEHFCQNTLGSFSCSCGEGFRIGNNGLDCEDIDECNDNQVSCVAPTQCVNTHGSYQCEVVCEAGYEQSEDLTACTDIDECSSEGERVCEHICFNTPGSFSCSCRDGFRTVGQTRCEDINECEQGACYGQIDQCVNSIGSYNCLNQCATGFEMVDGECLDVDECVDPSLNVCEQGCENVDGSYRCLCNIGYIRNSRLQKCIDVDECAVSAKTCQYRCSNTPGSFKCYCPKGYRVADNGRTCDDINECIEGGPKCASSDEMCANTFGGFDCVNTQCPETYIRRNGVCVKECLTRDCPKKYKHFLRFNSTFVRVGLEGGQPLLTLFVSYVGPSGELERHRNTRFQILTPPYIRSAQLFGLRGANSEQGIIYVKTKLLRRHISWYKLRVSAKSTKVDGSLEYDTVFNLYINVAPNPFEE